MTNVETTVAPTADNAMTGTIPEQLAARKRLPSEHLVDSADVTAERLVDRQQQPIDLVGPTPPEPGWQAKTGAGCAAACFGIDWAAQQATCPQGKTRVIWHPTTDRTDHAVVNMRCAHADGRACPVRPQCVSSTRSRSLTIRAHDQQVALQAARQRQTTAVFTATDAARAGIAGTISQGTRISDLRRSRASGVAQTRLLHLRSAAALHVVRVAAWLADRPRARTRRSAFAALAGAAP